MRNKLDIPDGINYINELDRLKQDVTDEVLPGGGLVSLERDLGLPRLGGRQLHPLTRPLLLKRPGQSRGVKVIKGRWIP